MQQLFTARGRLFIVAAIAALAVVVSIGAASASAGGGDSANASNAAKGGTQKPPKTSHKYRQSRLDCGSWAGTFSTDPASDLSGSVAPFSTFLWSCNGVSDRFAAAGPLGADCVSDRGTGFGSDSFDNPNLSCWRRP